MIYKNPEDRNRDLPQYTTILVGMYIFQHISIFLDVPKKHDITMTFPRGKLWRNQTPAGPCRLDWFTSIRWIYLIIPMDHSHDKDDDEGYGIHLVIMSDHAGCCVNGTCWKCWKMLKDVEKETGRVYLLGWWVLMMLAVHTVCHFFRDFWDCFLMYVII